MTGLRVDTSTGTWNAFLIWAVSGAALTVTTVVLYAVRQADTPTTLAIGLAVAAAAILAGGLIGFVFGIPRVLAADGQGGASAGPAGARPGIIANTNLEQISDWLTKILVGVGLTQFGGIARGTGRLFDAMAPALGGGRTATVFAGGVVTYSAVFGFVSGWLYTRLLLGGAMAAADQRAAAISLIEAAHSAETAGDTQSARQLREQALGLLRRAGAPGSVPGGVPTVPSLAAGVHPQATPVNVQAGTVNVQAATVNAQAPPVQPGAGTAPNGHGAPAAAAAAQAPAETAAPDHAAAGPAPTPPEGPRRPEAPRQPEPV